MASMMVLSAKLAQARRPHVHVGDERAAEANECPDEQGWSRTEPWTERTRAALTRSQTVQNFISLGRGVVGAIPRRSDGTA
jgi:hypothetical protein